MASQRSRLSVLIGDIPCGTLIEASTGALAFRYDAGYEGVPLSLSMPVGLTEYGDRIVRPYLMGLLPDEESTRAAIGNGHQFRAVRRAKPSDGICNFAIDTTDEHKARRMYD